MQRKGTFAVLFRTFFSQFFSSETVTSDEQLRQAIIWVVAFLFTPGLMLMLQVTPAYRIAVLTAARLHRPWIVDQMLASIASVWINYAIAGIGLVAVFCWDALSFDKRDAMVLGPMPVRGTTVICAKLSALAVLLLGTATLVNVTTGLPYAFATGSDHGFTFVHHLSAHMTGTMAASAFTFATVVTIRGIVGFVGSGRIATRLGAMLQFLFVVGVVCLVLVPNTNPYRPVASTDSFAPWLPNAWFLGLLEHLRGSPRDDFAWLGQRGLHAAAVATLAALIVSIVGFRRQVQLALAPNAFVGPVGSARLGRTLARGLVGRSPSRRAMTDFILLTIARNRAQQSPIAMGAAVGAGIVVIALQRNANTLAAMMQPRTVVLWAPLVLAYWTAIGLRGSFFVPSELPATWAFRTNASEHPRDVWAVVRASIIALIAPPYCALAILLAPLVGWRIALWHAAVTLFLVVLLAEVVALTVDHMPFTRPYPPGHAKLRTRAPLYLLGMFGFARWPVRLEQALFGHTSALIALVFVLAGFIAALEGAAAWLRNRKTPGREEEIGEDPWAMTALNISGA